jgi:hypothetical protein
VSEWNNRYELTSDSVIFYTIGKSKEVGGKLIVPALVLIHAFFFVFVAWELINDPKDYSLSVGSSMIEGMIAYTAVLSMPFILLLQFCSQYWELRKMADYGALSPRSCCMQAAVMAIMALRLFIKMEFNFDNGPDREKLGFFWRALSTVLTSYFKGFLSFNCLLWISGAAIIYFATRASKTLMQKENVELGIVLH